MSLSNIQKLMKYLRFVHDCVPGLIKEEFLEDDRHEVREVKQAVVAMCMYLCPSILNETVIYQRDQSNEYLQDDVWCKKEDYQNFHQRAGNLVGSIELMNMKRYVKDKKFTQADKKEFSVKFVMICTDEYLEFMFFKPFTKEVRILEQEGKFAGEKAVIGDARKKIKTEDERSKEKRKFFDKDLNEKTLSNALKTYRDTEKIKGTKQDLMIKRDQNVLLKRENRKQKLDTFVSEWTDFIFITFYILFIVGIVILVFHAYVSIFEAFYMNGDMIGMFHYFANGGEIIALAALFSFTLLLFGFTY